MPSTIVRKGLVALIEGQRRWRVCWEAATGDEAFRQAVLRRPDVVILNSALPEIDGWEVARLLEKSDRPPAIVILSLEHPGERTTHSVVSLNDNVAALWSAIQSASRGHRYVSKEFLETHPSWADRLSRRERQVLELLAQGRRPFHVARQLGISPKTVASHRLSIMRKFGVSSFVEALRYAISRGLVPNETQTTKRPPR